jgi:hypothetical protein
MSHILTPVTTTRGPAGNDIVCQGRIVSPDGTGTAVTNEGNAIRQVDVSAISCSVYDVTSSPATLVGSPTITAAAVLNVLTADNEWGGLDTTGCNFRFQVAGSYFATGGRQYRIVFSITTTGGTVLKWYHHHFADAVTPS